MAEDPWIHVVIPTGGRVETIGSTLLSCAQQDYERLVVWVCDNSFAEETEAIVNSFSDRRFKLIRPPHRLCMAENWEFALSNITSGYVTIIGDDDCLMPDCLSTVSQLIKQYPTTPVINHLPGNYFWPNYPDAYLANKLQLRDLDFEIQLREARPILARVSSFTEWYGHLPFLYHGFINAEHITKIKTLADTPFFNFCAPDIYSDIVLALHTEQFLVVNSPLTLGGQSAKSNGANYAAKNSIAKQFISELPEHLRFTYDSMSSSLAVFNALEIAFKAFPDQSADIVIDYDRLLANAIHEVTPYGAEALSELRGKLLLIYPEAAVDKAFAAMDKPTDEIISPAPNPPALPKRLARKLVSGLASCKALLWKARNAAKREAEKEPLAEASHHSGLHWQDNTVVLDGYLDLSDSKVTTVDKAAQYLHECLCRMQSMGPSSKHRATDALQDPGSPTEEPQSAITSPFT
ncbi:MAG: glycosyltransferase family A protein [Cyanobium sp.]